MATPPKARCAIYARVSPKPEGAAGDNFSIDSQLFEMRALALKAYGCAAPDEYIDRNKSGATLERPELDRLRDNVRRRLYDVVIAHSPDRWSRGELVDRLILDEEITKGGAKLAFVSGNYDTDTAEGEFARDAQAIVAKYEHRKFRDRSRRCRQEKSRNGHPHACLAPDGYIYEGHKFGKKGAYVIVPERAKIVKLIFAKIADGGMTCSRLAIWLNAEGIETHTAWMKRKGIKTRRKIVTRWLRPNVARVLKKTAYYGEMIQNGETILVPAIVSRELWDRAHEALQRNLIGRVGREPREYLLSGMLWCARCDRRCRVMPQGNYPAYRCNHVDAANRSIRFCHAPQIARSILEPLVWAAIWDAVCAPGLLWQLIEAYHERVAEQPSKKKPVLARIDRARRSVGLAEKILRDPDKPIPYEQAKADLAAARRELAEAQVAAGAEVAIMPLRKDVAAASAQFRSMREKLQSFASRRKALLLLVEKIRYADGDAEIHCRLPAENCHHGICDDDNLSNAFPFVINATVPPRSPEHWAAAARKVWETRRKRPAA